MRANYTAIVASIFVAFAACSANPGAKGPETNPLDNAPPADTAAIAAAQDAPPIVSTDAPDMDFLKDLSQRSARQAAQCDSPENPGPRGEAMVDVTFEAVGHTGNVVVRPPHTDTPIGNCIARAFAGVHATPFKGEPVVINQKVDFKPRLATPAASADKKPTPPSMDKKPEKKKNP